MSVDAMLPEWRQLRQLVAELSLVSHISGVQYDGKTARATDEEAGGKRPTGGDREPRPRRPRGPDPRTDPDCSSSEQVEWDEWEAEVEAWEQSYHRRTPQYFQREAARVRSEARLRALVGEAEETLAAWRRQPFPAGGEPASMADSDWKRWVIEGDWSVKEIVNRYGCSRQYVYRLRSEAPSVHVAPAAWQAAQ